MHTGGAPVFPGLRNRIRTTAPSARITAVYGSTEAEPIAGLDVDTLGAEDRAAMVSGGGLRAGRPVDGGSNAPDAGPLGDPDRPIRT